MVPKAITFDVYGTLIDWEGEIRKYFSDFMASKGITSATPYQVQQRWEEVQFEYIKTYRPYRQVLKDTMGPHLPGILALFYRGGLRCLL